jgi:hypothetical protein
VVHGRECLPKPVEFEPGADSVFRAAKLVPVVAVAASETRRGENEYNKNGPGYPLQGIARDNLKKYHFCITFPSGRFSCRF